MGITDARTTHASFNGSPYISPNGCVQKDHIDEYATDWIMNGGEDISNIRGADPWVRF
jgi:hypothetical protein